MRLRVTFPQFIHAHCHAVHREFQLVDAAHEIDTVHVNEIRDHLARREPLLIDSVGCAPDTLELNALERLRACVEICTESGDCLELDGTSRLLNGRHVATLPESVRTVNFMPIRTPQYLRDEPGRFVAILGRGGALLFDLHTHQLIDATMPLATVQRVAGGAA